MAVTILVELVKVWTTLERRELLGAAPCHHVVLIDQGLFRCARARLLELLLEELALLLLWLLLPGIALFLLILRPVGLLGSVIFVQKGRALGL